MRVLDFLITGQRIACDPRCDFTGIATGTRGYLQARFRFSSDWTKCKRVAVFRCRGKEHPVAVINGVCTIPEEALLGSRVEVHVVGQRDDYRIVTNTTWFEQEV